MWDLIVSVSDHCLSFYFTGERIFRSETTPSDNLIDIYGI